MVEKKVPSVHVLSIFYFFMMMLKTNFKSSVINSMQGAKVIKKCSLIVALKENNGIYLFYVAYEKDVNHVLCPSQSQGLNH